MSAEKNLRNIATKHLMKLLRQGDFQVALKDVGYVDENPIIVALDSDSLGDVLGRIFDSQSPAPAIVAMYRTSSDDLVLWGIGPGDSHEAGAPSIMEARNISTIGMLFDCMETANLNETLVAVAFSSTPTAVRRAEMVGV